MSPNSAPGRRCASRLDQSISVSIDRSPDITPVATTQSPAVKCELSAAGDAETDDRRRAGEHGSLDRMRLKSDISAAGEHAHARRRGDPGFCFQPRDNNQTSPLTRRPANDWLNALLKIRAGRRQAVCALYESFGKMPIGPGLAAVAAGRNATKNPDRSGASFGAESRRRSASKIVDPNRNERVRIRVEYQTGARR